MADARRARTRAKRTLRFLDGRTIQKLRPRQRGAYLRQAILYWRAVGFPYPSPKHQQIQRLFTSFATSKWVPFRRPNVLAWSPSGLEIANSFHREIWSIKCERFRTPLQVFHDDQLLHESIRRATQYWKDRKPLTARHLRHALCTFVNTKRVSAFRPTIAKALYERYTREGDLIIDPAAGFGGRLLGALPLKRRYIGIEPSTRTYHGSQRMLRVIRQLPEAAATARLINARAETALSRLPTSSAALILLSPPYYSRERYATDPSQSWIRYPTYREWCAGFLREVIRLSHAVLKPGGYFVLNVANTESHAVGDDARRIAGHYFTHTFTYRMLIGCVPFHRNGQRGGFRSEPVIIYRKPENR